MDSFYLKVEELKVIHIQKNIFIIILYSPSDCFDIKILSSKQSIDSQTCIYFK